METFLIKALQLIVSLSILVIVHELGHFFFSRLFKVRVEKFYLFFNPWFSLFKYKPKNSDTEYGVGWLPLGGYCKISGMIDESMDKEAMAQPPKPYEFRSKPAGQRLLIMAGGGVFNFLFALIIYSMVLFHWGDSYLPLKNMEMGMDYSETFHQIGFKDGDILLKADTVSLFDEDCLRSVVSANNVTVLRNGVEVIIPIPKDMMKRVLKDKKGFASMRFPMIVKDVANAESPAAVAGIEKGDHIVSIDGVETQTFYDAALALHKCKGKLTTVGVERNGMREDYSLQVDSAGKIGVVVEGPAELYKTVTKKYNFFASFPAGISRGVHTLKSYVSDMQYVFTKEGASSIGGFGSIGGLFPSSWDWEIFWERTAWLSVVLAFMNILPIPALDGGHILFLLYEVVTRRKPSDKFLEYAQVVGMFLLFALLLYANGNDVFRYFFK